MFYAGCGSRMFPKNTQLLFLAILKIQCKDLCCLYMSSSQKSGILHHSHIVDGDSSLRSKLALSSESLT